MRITHASVGSVLLLGVHLIVEPVAGQSVPVVRNDPSRAIWSTVPAWRLSSTPRVAIGSVEGDPAYTLYLVSWAKRMVDGRVVILNAGTSEFRVYASDGKYLASFGGGGDGPGEMRNPQEAVVLDGDSILVQDAARITVFDWIVRTELPNPGKPASVAGAIGAPRRRPCVSRRRPHGSNVRRGCGRSGTGDGVKVRTRLGRLRVRAVHDRRGAAGHDR